MSEAPIALVTGADRGLGLETARRFAELGSTVYLGSRDEGRGQDAVRELERTGHSARLLLVDITDDESVQRAAQQIEAEHGHLDVLVNNAGILVRKPALEVAAADVRAELETNVVGLVRVVHAMIPLLRRSTAARVVNISSDSSSLTYTAERGSMFEGSHESFVYSASKAAVNMLTLKYANAFRADPELAHVTVVAVTPGYTATALNGFAGTRTAEESAAGVVRRATVVDDGDSGGFFDDTGRVPW